MLSVRKMRPIEVENRLKGVFPGATVTVNDLTGTNDHYEVAIVSDLFNGKSRIDRQRMVMDAFAEELKTGEVHALTIQTKER